MLQQTIDKKRSNWHNKLYSTLWAYRTIVKTAIGFTPFHLVHKVDVILPIECETLMLLTVIYLLPETTVVEE